MSRVPSLFGDALGGKSNPVDALKKFKRKQSFVVRCGSTRQHWQPGRVGKDFTTECDRDGLFPFGKGRA